MRLAARIERLERAHADDGPRVFVCWGDCDTCAHEECTPDVVVGWDEERPSENKKYLFPGDPGRRLVGFYAV